MTIVSPFKNAIPINFLRNNVLQNRPRETDAAQQPYFTDEESGALTSWQSQGHRGITEPRTQVWKNIKTMLIGIHREGENVS